MFEDKMPLSLKRQVFDQPIRERGNQLPPRDNQQPIENRCLKSIRE